MSHWQTTIGSPNTAEKYRRPNRGTRRYKTDLIISKQCRRGRIQNMDRGPCFVYVHWTLGKQLIF